MAGAVHSPWLKAAAQLLEASPWVPGESSWHVGWVGHWGTRRGGTYTEPRIGGFVVNSTSALQVENEVEGQQQKAWRVSQARGHAQGDILVGEPGGALQWDARAPQLCRPPEIPKLPALAPPLVRASISPVGHTTGSPRQGQLGGSSLWDVVANQDTGLEPSRGVYASGRNAGLGNKGTEEPMRLPMSPLVTLQELSFPSLQLWGLRDGVQVFCQGTQERAH